MKRRTEWIDGKQKEKDDRRTDGKKDRMTGGKTKRRER
jgi:hypothetical protein